jgi:hypothetical protein
MTVTFKIKIYRLFILYMAFKGILFKHQWKLGYDRFLIPCWRIDAEFAWHQAAMSQRAASSTVNAKD